MNYKKWDTIDNESDEGNDHSALSDVSHFFKIKHNADYLFSLSQYEQCVTIYHDVISSLKQSQHNPENSISRQELNILCHLNLSCCFLKINEWAKCTQTCEELITECQVSVSKFAANAESMSTLTAEQYCRCLYFQAFSLCQISQQSVTGSVTATRALERAMSGCDDIQAVAARVKSFTDKSLLGDVKNLVSQIHYFQRKLQLKAEEEEASSMLPTDRQTETSTNTSELIGMSSPPSSQIPNTITSLLQRSTVDMAKNQPLAALQSLKQCLILMQRRVHDCEDSLLDSRVVECYRRMGDCFQMTSDFDEAISMYEKACQHISEDQDEVAQSTSSTTSQPGDQSLATSTSDLSVPLPPACVARGLHLRAAECAHKSASFHGAMFTRESNLHRAIEYYSNSLADIPMQDTERVMYFHSEGLMTLPQQYMALQTDATALQGLAVCNFELEGYDEALRWARRAVEVVNAIRAADIDDFFEYPDRESSCGSANTNTNTSTKSRTRLSKGGAHVRKRIENIWHKQMSNYEILTFSLFKQSLLEEALAAVDEALEFSSLYLKAHAVDDSTAPAATTGCGFTSVRKAASSGNRPLSRNNTLLKFLTLKNHLLVSLSRFQSEELTTLWEAIKSCGDCFVSHGEIDEAGKIYKLCGEYFMSRSGRSAFNLDDKSKAMAASDDAFSAYEVNGVAAKYIKSHTYALLTQLQTMDPESGTSADIRGKVHRGVVSTVRVLFLQGVCADSFAQATRNLQAALSLCGEFDRLMSDTQSHHRHGGQRGAQLGELADPLLLEEYLFLRGDIMHHLCFCYLQCGQLDYALEEAQRAIGLYEGVHQSYKQLQENDGDEEAADGAADDDNILARAQQPQRQTILQSLHACTKACYPNEQPGERGLPGVVFRLRHAWGLMAVVRKRRRENGLSEVALEKVRALQLPGPVMAQDSNKDLQQLTEILAPPTATVEKRITASSDLSEATLVEKWEKIKAASEKRSGFGSSQATASAHAYGSLPFDGNLLFAYFVLTCVASFIVYMSMSFMVL